MPKFHVLITHVQPQSLLVDVNAKTKERAVQTVRTVIDRYDFNLDAIAWHYKSYWHEEAAFMETDVEQV